MRNVLIINTSCYNMYTYWKKRYNNVKISSKGEVNGKIKKTKRNYINCINDKGRLSPLPIKKLC